MVVTYRVLLFTIFSSLNSIKTIIFISYFFFFKIMGFFLKKKVNSGGDKRHRAFSQQ